MRPNGKIPAFAALLIFAPAAVLALSVGILRTSRPGVIFNYAEGMTLGSLAAFLEGGLAALYPAAWTDAPLVLTLYTPGFFLTSGAMAGTIGGGAVLASRLVSLAATAGVAALLADMARRSAVSRAMLVIGVGAVLAHPGVYRQIGAAQPDMLALAWTVAGVRFALGPRGTSRRLPALVCFALAAFTKQSYVAAPFAWILHRWRAGERRSALEDAGWLGGAGLAGVLALQGVSGGGFLHHAVGAVTDGMSLESARQVFVAGHPLIWLPLLAAVFLATRRGSSRGFPEWWLLVSFILHGAASVKLGASVNYFLEPLVALLVVLIVRSPRPESREHASTSAGRHRANPASGVARAAAVAALAFLSLGTLISARQMLSEVAATRSAVNLELAGSLDGHPLVTVDFFPALIEQGVRPYLNDPFAFGALAASGTWNPEPVSADLTARRIPIVITRFDLTRDAPPAASFEQLMFGYFWLMPHVREPLLAGYRSHSQPGFWLWRPTEPAG